MKHVVIFNLVDHRSLMAAVALHILSAEPCVIVDVRDNIPMDAEKYTLLDVGNVRHMQGYLEALSKDPASGKVVRAWLKKLSQSSTVITTHYREGMTVDDSSLGMVLLKLLDEKAIEGPMYRLFCRVAVMGNTFHQANMQVEACAVYYRLIDLCYQYYHGVVSGARIIEQITRLASVLGSTQCEVLMKEEVEKFKSRQQYLNTALSSKTREINVAGHMVLYTTMMGPEIYGLIRRMAMANREYIHCSQGSFGMVLHGNTELADILNVEGHGVYKLFPAKVVTLRQTA